MMYMPKKLTKGMCRVHFFKYNEDKYLAEGHIYASLIPDTDKENNYFAMPKDMKAFRYLLSDFGLDPIVYPDKAQLLEAGLINYPYETRITDFQLIKYFQYSEIQSYDIRDTIMTDALKGNQRFFKGQVKLDNPIGINYHERVDEVPLSGESPLIFPVRCLKSRRAIAPEKDFQTLENLTPYCGTEDIYRYQIRLYYENPVEQYLDLFSVFEFINNELGTPFEFMVETE